MIEAKCECCGGRMLLPDPSARTQEEKVAFRKEWDRLYEERRPKMDTRGQPT